MIDLTRKEERLERTARRARECGIVALNERVGLLDKLDG